MQTVASFPAEFELLFCCARIDVDIRTRARIVALVTEGVDWDYLEKIATRHRLVSLLYRNLNAICPEAVPSSLLDELRRRFHTHALRNAFLSRELLRLLDLFEANGILAVPYKGPALAAAIYGSLSFRKSGDLDIVVRRQDVLKATELLITAGYTPRLDKGLERHFLREHYHLTFLRNDDSVLVEIHWAFAYASWRFPITLEALAPRLETTTLTNKTIPALPRQDLLLILCTHGAKDGWRHLVWVCDIAEFLRKNSGVSWDALLHKANQIRFRRILFLGLFLAKELLDAPIPVDVWQQVNEDRVIPALAAGLRAGMFSPTVQLCEQEIKEFHLRLRESFRDRLRYFLHDHRGVLRTVLTPNDEDRSLVAVPTRLGFVYYVLRPFRLAAVCTVRFPALLLKYFVTSQFGSQ
jgi:hypothetical protein